MIGKTLAHYEIVEKIGAGGMGEVYRALDSKLGREVAVKVLPPEFAADPERLMRFEREARAVAALSHPNIVVVHSVEEADGLHFLTMEFVRGESLDRVMPASGLPLDRFLALGVSLADAVDAAHRGGITHRDLKPANVMVDHQGRPKVLDFGLAKLIEAESLDEAAATSLQSSATREGRILGTAAYMSPEQAEGKAVDHRSDIFSLGTMLYEMATGQRPFRGDSHISTLAAVLRDEPRPVTEIRGLLPERLDPIIRRCLRKDVESRYQSAADLRNDLREIREEIAAKRLLDGGRGGQAGTEARVDGRGPVARGIRWIGALLLLGAVILGGRALLDRLGSGEFDGYLLVAPFENLSPDPDVDYFATGFTEAVRVRLSGIGGIHIADADNDIGTRLLLEGGVQRAEDDLRVTFRIVDRQQGLSLYADEVQGRIKDLFELQNLVAIGVSEALAGTFPVEPIRGEETHPTKEVEAYDLYLSARGLLRDYEDPDDVDRALRMLEQALTVDPGFALARAGLGEAWWRRYENTKDPADARKAEEISRAAVVASPDLAQAHVALGTVYLQTGRPDRAEREFEIALEIDAKSDGAYLGLARSHADRGDLEAAERACSRALEARPDYWGIYNTLGRLYYQNGRMADAIAQFRKVVELTPNNARGFSNLGAMYFLTGESGSAEEAYRRSVEIRPNGPALSNLATLLKSQGRYEGAIDVYRKAVEESPNDYRIWGNLGALYSLIPDRKEERLTAYRRAVVLGEAKLDVNPNDPELLATLAQWYALVGRRYDATEAIERALEIAPRNLAVLQYVAPPLVALGDTTQAIQVLREAFELGLPIDAIMNEPSLATLHEHPEFQRLVRKHRDQEEEGSP